MLDAPDADPGGGFLAEVVAGAIREFYSALYNPH
jgi:hypothetical protein